MGMHMNSLRNLHERSKLWHLVILMLLMSAVLTACAASSQLVNHTFEFDARWDSPDVMVLNYRYGDSKQPGVRSDDNSLGNGKTRQYAGISGDMLRGEYLYVKWLIKSTGKAYEDTVDLSSRLPKNINNHTIRFIIEGAQLYVYLISPRKLESNSCPTSVELQQLRKSVEPDDKIFSRYCYMEIIRIYPN